MGLQQVASPLESIFERDFIGSHFQGVVGFFFVLHRIADWIFVQFHLQLLLNKKVKRP